MNDELKMYQKELSGLSKEEERERNLYLRRLSLGEIQGPLTCYASINKPWLQYYDEEAIIKEKPECSIYDMIYQNNKDYLENIAISYYDKNITYRELFENIEKVAKSLKANGIKEGDIVSVSLPNIPESVYVFYALSKIGAIANMIDPRSSSSDIAHYINEVESDLLIVLEDVSKKIFEILDDLPVLKKIVTVSATDSLINNGIVNNDDSYPKIKICNYNSFLEDGKLYSKDTYVSYVPNRPIVIEHTGGTTGTPKGVLLTNDAINMITHHFMVSDLKFDRDQKWLNIMPPFIAYGVGNGLHLPLAIGMCVIEVPKFEPNKIDELIAMYKPNNFTGVPIHYESIIHSDKLDNVDFSNWVLPGVGGDTMDTNLEKEANQFLEEHRAKTKVIKGYGLTEVCAAACVTFGKSNKIGSVGIPFVHNNISIFDTITDENGLETYDELGYGKRGEICIHSPSIMIEYFKNQKETNAVMKRHDDGKIWMHTGDVGYMLDDGSIFIDGRIKRVIVRYDGFKIYPFGIEKLIASIPEVEACKAIATPDVDHVQGSLPQANIILKPEYREKQEEILPKIKRACDEGLAEYAIPSEFKFRDSFPRTPIGKIDYVSMEKENTTNVKRKVKTKE